MNQQLFIQSSEGLLIAAACIGLIFVILASVYDFLRLARRRSFQSISTSWPDLYQPHVTVLVYAKDSSATLETCLLSIRRSYYREYDIMVVDNMSADATKQVVAGFVKKSPTQQLYFYQKRKNSGRLQALRLGYEKSRRGDIVLVLDATSTISPRLLGNAVVQFVADHKLLALRLNQNIKDIQSSTLLSFRFLQLSRNIYAKSASLLSTGRINFGKSAMIYRSSVLAKDYYVGNIKKVPYRYDGELVVTTKRPPRLGVIFGPIQIVGWLFLVLPILFLITYSLYAAVSLQSSALLVLSWSMFVIWLFVAVVSDEGSNVVEKISFLFRLPAVFFILYVQAVFYFVGMILGVPRLLTAFGTKKQKYN
ncbi:MAG: glycosyltransferase family 2 protein [Candidatus Saccharibacteria bacterium]